MLKKNVNNLFDRAERVGLRLFSVSLLVVGLAKILLSELTGLKDIFNFQEIRQLLPTIGIWLGAVALILSLVSFFVFLFNRKAANTSGLKREVAGAFIKALENSSFNPRRLENKNEQSSPRTTQ